MSNVSTPEKPVVDDSSGEESSNKTQMIVFGVIVLAYQYVGCSPCYMPI